MDFTILGEIKEAETLVMAELHWYEASGIGKKEFKIKYILGE